MILDHFPSLIPYSPEDKDKVALAAESDGHGVFVPTELIVKNGEVVGWVSQGGVPMVMTWIHTKKVSPRDSLQLLQTVEGIQRRLGAPCIVFPCMKDSPFYPVMERLGYANMGTYDLFYK